MSEPTLQPGHPGNRVWMAVDYLDYTVLVAAPDHATARRIAFRAFKSYGSIGQDDNWEILRYLRVHQYKHPDGSIMPTEYQGYAESEGDYDALGFASDEEYTWCKADGRPEEIK